MSEKYRYKNTSSAPMYIPGKRGESIHFAPGQGSTDEWFSRFVGPRMLTRELIKPEEATPMGVPTTPIVPQAAPTAPVPPPPQQPGRATFEDKETKEYSLKSGVYRCKLCDLFQTGSHESMESHLQKMHKQTETPVPAPLPTADEGDERIVIPSATAASPEPLKEEETTEVSTKATVEADAESEDPVFTCTVPGCGKVFKNKRGLTMHMTRMHRK